MRDVQGRDTTEICSNNKPDLSYSILWSPLHPITCILPFIGHLGISDSNGIASDFQGPYHVGDNGRMAFGPPTRALKIDISDLPGGETAWNEAISHSNQIYRGRMHNLFCDNCHSHVAYALNSMGIRAYGISSFDMVKLCFLLFFRARFLSFWGFFYQFAPTFIILLLVVIFMV